MAERPCEHCDAEVRFEVMEEGPPRIVRMEIAHDGWCPELQRHRAALS